MDETSQAIGALQAQVEILREEVSSLTAKVEQLVAIMNAGKGSWRTIATIGALILAIATGGAALLKFFIR